MPANTGVVRWVNPPSRRAMKLNQSRGDTRLNLNSNHSTSLSSYNSEASEGYTIVDENEINRQDVQLKVDPLMCKTLCNFVEEHLKQLREHQKLIAKTRDGYNFHNQQAKIHNNIEARNDSAIKLRDEQTKAIETIKQLTNYLKELSNLKKQCDLVVEPTHDDFIDKLLDLRTEIIHSLNDFVLSNNDICSPIIDAGDRGCNEYDLCMDARVSHNNSLNDTGFSESIETSIDPKNTSRDQNTLIELSDNIDDYKSGGQQLLINSNPHLVHLEKRRKEVQKLEKDTEELRQLFTDFCLLVKDQGEQISSIEDNIVIATESIKQGRVNLSMASKSLAIIVPVTGCLAGALIGGPIGLVVGGKVGSITMGCTTSLIGLISSTYSLRRSLASRNK